MSWCDKLASTPMVGLLFVLRHQSSDSILDALAPLFDSWVDGRKQRFSIEKQEPFKVEFATDDGFHYVVNQQRVTVEFRYGWRVKRQSARAPVPQLQSEPRLFTALLPRVAERAIEAANFIYGARPPSPDRIGVVSITNVAENDAPPGILRLVEFIQRPWGKQVNY